MTELLNNPYSLGIIIFVVFSIFLFQLFIILRIKKILLQISFYIESISRFFYRVGISSSLRAKTEVGPKTCQYCKYRMSFIHMSENEAEVEDFYYKCRLRNVEIDLKDSCQQFEPEPQRQ
ncbi:MAG: hypothetical protein P8Y60_04090 [Calditrichota bacterium]|jgi:hypothetical protein